MGTNASTSGLPPVPRQTEAIKAQQTWSIWLVTVQLGAIAAVVSSKNGSIPHPLPLVLAIAFSVVSIVAGSFLLSAHASMILRIEPTRKDLNIQIYGVRSPESWYFAFLQHSAFIVAVISYATHICLRALN
jgi:hypothetical protein